MLVAESSTKKVLATEKSLEPKKKKPAANDPDTTPSTSAGPSDAEESVHASIGGFWRVSEIAKTEKAPVQSLRRLSSLALNRLGIVPGEGNDTP